MKIHEKDTDFLLSSLRGGHSDAFSELDAMFEPLQKACVQKIAGSVKDASKEEMMQEARYALYRAALSFSGEQSEVTFGLYAKICIHRALISRFLRKKSLPTCSLEQLSQETDFEVKEGLFESDALSALIEEESAVALLSRMQEVLSPFEMQVCSMKAEEISAKEIAAALGCTKKSVENALARASLKFRKA